jgi:hypothetical protein
VKEQPLTAQAASDCERGCNKAMTHSQNLAVVEDLLVAVECTEAGQTQIVDSRIEIDLAEFDLTPEELKKFSRLLHKINRKVMDALAEVCPAVSISAEIRRRQEQ